MHMQVVSEPCWDMAGKRRGPERSSWFQALRRTWSCGAWRKSQPSGRLEEQIFKYL